MVAFAGLTLQDEPIMNWGFNRTARQGNYFSMVDRMLVDGGVWQEAPIYPVYGRNLWCMATMSFYRRLYDGKDWFTWKSPGGGSPRGLMDYFIDTAYPIERTGVGSGGFPSARIRIATFGDGSTNPGGDTFLSDLLDELTIAYACTGDAGYGGLLAVLAAGRQDGKMKIYYSSPLMYAGSKPNLWDRPPLPEGEPQLPPAPSKVWPTFGLAMLRSDESPNYWTSPESIAIQHILTRPYGHDQPHKFHISMFGAGRLLYPDFLALQYEHRGMGWTYTSSSHNTMQVDEQDTRAVQPHGSIGVSQAQQAAIVHIDVRRV